MGFRKSVKKLGKKLKKKVLKPLVSTVVGAAVGFVLGGPAGAVAGGVTSLAVSLTHKDSVAIAASVPLGPAPVHHEQEIKREESKVEGPLFIINEENVISNEGPVFINNQVVTPNEETLTDKIGNVIINITDLYYKIDNAACTNIRFKINVESDPVDLQMMKMRANNLLKDIEKESGENPFSDIIKGTELKKLAKDIKEYGSKKICPSCNGATCANCHHSGFVFY